MLESHGGNKFIPIIYQWMQLIHKLLHTVVLL